MTILTFRGSTAGVARVLVEQLAAVDLSRLGERVGRITPREDLAIDDALKDVLAL